MMKAMDDSTSEIPIVVFTAKDAKPSNELKSPASRTMPFSHRGDVVGAL